MNLILLSGIYTFQPKVNKSISFQFIRTNRYVNIDQNSFMNIDQAVENKAVEELYKKFLLGHQNSQIKQKQGIVFIGNSRIGKSTISAIISGLKMQLILDGNQFKIQPKQIKYRSNKNIIQHTLTSVTEFPNIYEATINGKLYTVVDLPGFKDSSYEKELCNWHYIKSILQQLDKILFVMVMQVHTDTKMLQDFQLEMMQRFSQAFPCTKALTPKKNLITVINFMQNLDPQINYEDVKLQINKNVLSQLQKLDLTHFYSKSLEGDRIFLMQKIKRKANSQKQIKEGSEYQNPRLLEFIKRNTYLIEQTQHSNFKINLTKEMNDQSKNLRRILLLITQKMANSLLQKFVLYRSLLAHLLSRLATTDGVVCDKNDYEDLRKYNEKHKMAEYMKIAIYFGYSSDQSKKQQEVIYQIAGLFAYIGKIKDQINFPKTVKQIREICMNFINLIESLCSKLFKGYDLDDIEQINKNMKKSIHIDCHNLAYIYESVENFNVNLPDSNTDFYGHCGILIEQFINKVNRTTSFKNEITSYLTKLLKNYEKTPAKKLDSKNLDKLMKACNDLGLKELKSQAITVIYKTNQTKLMLPQYLSRPQQICQILEELSKNQLKEEEKNRIQVWKKQNSDWQYIRNKQALQFLNILKSIKGRKQQVAKFYMKFDHSFQKLMDIIVSIVDDAQKQSIINNKKSIYDLCMDSADHLAKNRQFEYAQRCCKMGINLYMFEDKENVIRAKMKLIQIRNRGLQRIDQEQEERRLNMQGWVGVKDEQYEWIKGMLMDSRDMLVEDRQRLGLEEMEMSKRQSNRSGNGGQGLGIGDMKQIQVLVGMKNEQGSMNMKSPRRTINLLRDEDQRKPRGLFRKSLKD